MANKINYTHLRNSNPRTGIVHLVMRLRAGTVAGIVGSNPAEAVVALLLCMMSVLCR
jgi:hypothetical protein